MAKTWPTTTNIYVHCVKLTNNLYAIFTLHLSMAAIIINLYRNLIYGVKLVSTVSIDECNNKKTKSSVLLDTDRCGTLCFEFNVLNVKSKDFSRVCSSKAECDDAREVKNCNQANGTCYFRCCDSNLCSSSDSMR